MRAPLAATVFQAFSRLRNVKSPSLQEKLKFLEVSDQGELKASTAWDEKDSSASIVSESLWSILQQHSFHPDAARSLKAIE